MTFVKRLFLILLILSMQAALVACKKSHSVGKAPPSVGGEDRAGNGLDTSSVNEIRSGGDANLVVNRDAAEGTMDAGGADFIEHPDATPEDVHNAFVEAKKVVPLILRFLDAYRKGDRGPLRTWEKGQTEIYKGLIENFFDPTKEDIYQYYSSVIWDVREDRPCKDKDGNDKAASAYPWESRSICISISMISKIAKRVDLVRRLSAMIVHELLHKRDLRGEDQVLPFEKRLATDLPEDPEQYLKYYLELVHQLLYADEEDPYYAGLKDKTVLTEPEEEALYYFEERESLKFSVTSYCMRILRLYKNGEIPAADESKFQQLLLRIQQAAFAVEHSVADLSVPLEIYTSADYEALRLMKELVGAIPTTATKDLEALIRMIYTQGRQLSDSLHNIDFEKLPDTLWRELHPI